MAKRTYRTDIKGRVYSVIALIVLLIINLAGLYLNGSRIIFTFKSDKIPMQVSEVLKSGDIKVKYRLSNGKLKYGKVYSEVPGRYKEGSNVYGYINKETNEIKLAPDVELTILEKGVHTIFFVLLVLYILALIYGEVSIQKHQRKMAKFK